MIAASAGNDAGGIATFASVGAEHGYRLLWILIPITISLGLVQEMCARMGAVTGKGLADLIRERFGVRWTAFVMLALLIANGGVTVSEFVGIAAATELFGVPRFISVPLSAVAIWWLVVKSSYQRVERVFLLDVAGFSRLHRLRFSGKARLGSSGRRTGEAEFQSRPGLPVHLRGGCRHNDLALHAGVRSIVSGGKRCYSGRLPQNKNGRLGRNDSRDAGRLLHRCFNGRTLHKHGLHIESAADAARALETTGRAIRGDVVCGWFVWRFNAGRRRVAIGDCLFNQRSAGF